MMISSNRVHEVQFSHCTVFAGVDGPDPKTMKLLHGGLVLRGSVCI